MIEIHFSTWYDKFKMCQEKAYRRRRPWTIRWRTPRGAKDQHPIQRRPSELKHQELHLRQGGLDLGRGTRPLYSEGFIIRETGITECLARTGTITTRFADLQGERHGPGGRVHPFGGREGGDVLPRGRQEVCGWGSEPCGAQADGRGHKNHPLRIERVEW